MQKPFDVAKCQHQEGETCTCRVEDQVLPSWSMFLADQRGVSQITGVLTTRSLSLRISHAKVKEMEERKTKSVEKRINESETMYENVPFKVSDEENNEAS